MKKKRFPHFFLILLECYLIIPFAVTLIYSLHVEWIDILPHGFTFRNYANLLTDTDFWAAMGRTLILSTVSVFFTIILMLLAMYVVTVTNRKLGAVMQVLCMIPYALQGVILSISIISIYSGTGTVLSNRLLMLFGAYTIMVLPYIYQGIRNSLNAIDAAQLIQAAEVLGCTNFQAYVRVIIPTIKQGIIVCALLAESIVFGDFVLANNIAGNNYENVQVYLNDKMNTSSGLSSAIVVVLFIVVMFITGVVLSLQNRQAKEEK